jgi:hypothetical protein
MPLIYEPEKDSLRCACRDYAAWLDKEAKPPAGGKTAPVRITLRSETPIGTLDGEPVYGGAYFGAVFERTNGGYRVRSDSSLGGVSKDLLTFEFEFTDDEIAEVRARAATEVHDSLSPPDGAAK